MLLRQSKMILLLSMVCLASCGKEEKSQDVAQEKPVVEPEKPIEPTKPTNPTGNSEEFTSVVVPIFEQHCATCHNVNSGLPTDFLKDEKAAKGKALAKIQANLMPKGAANLKAFAPFKASVVAILTSK